MHHDLSPRKNFSLLTEAFLGPREARAGHRCSVSSPRTIESGLQAMQARWPELRSQNQSAPIFVFSAGWRSGSTFLQRWIMTGDEVLVWGEPYHYAGLIRSLAGQLKAFTGDWPRDDFFVGSRDRTRVLSQAWVANLYPSVASFMDAHIAFLERLFLDPALACGNRRWGLKAVTLNVGHACYLRWLFPRARFVFLCRDPFEAWGSYRRWRSWYRRWPSEPVFTPARFGAVWRELATDFVANHHKVDGLLLRYEDLQTQACRTRLEDYLGFRLANPSSLARVSGSPAADHARGHAHWVPRLEAFLLKRKVEPVSAQLGYPGPD